jgi:hypothetical protein
LEACFIVTDSAGQKLAFIYFEKQPSRRAALMLAVLTALLTAALLTAALLTALAGLLVRLLLLLAGLLPAAALLATLAALLVLLIALIGHQITPCLSQRITPRLGQTFLTLNAHNSRQFAMQRMRQMTCVCLDSQVCSVNLMFGAG